MMVEDILSALRGRKLPLTDEKLLQVAMGVVFDAAGLPLTREVRLGNGDIIDFFGEGVGVEVKIKGSKRDIYRQLERYAAHDQVERMILVTNVPMGLPGEINGKPIRVHNLAVAWL